ncbi:hypothetical protein GbCGDNIH7_7201a [Granulibacter bethesdensis]|nr:hypothetical protein GbCGDNIH7_7201a [Granulibacter bethesdensis]
MPRRAPPRQGLRHQQEEPPYEGPSGLITGGASDGVDVNIDYLESRSIG